MSILDHKWGESIGADRVWALVAGLRPSLSGRRLLMVVQAYIDESIEEPDGVFVFGGYISTAERWAEFSKEWELLLPRFGVLKGGTRTYHFKYNEMSSVPERRERIKIFEKAARRHALMSISSRIHIGEMRRAQMRLHVRSQSVDFAEYANPYHLAYRCLMDKFHNNRSIYDCFLPKGEKVDFIFDERSGDKKAILNAWDEYIASRDDEVRHLYGQTPIFRSDNDFLPLQAADLVAGQMREAYANGNVSDLFHEQGDDNGFPHLRMEWNEDQLVEAFIKVIRNQTDDIIYDLRGATVHL